MNLKKWDNIIIDWVNCLKLSDHVKKIEDLKNGTFLINLLKLLTSDDFYNNQNILQLLTKFLKNGYPNIGFLNSSTQLKNLQHEEIIINYSLLLHYCCICDGRASFTFPLCHWLSRDYQICIRTFLENITTESTIDRAFDAIRSAVNKYIKTKDIYTNTSLNTTIGCSPLQELLNISSTQLKSLETLDEVLQTLEEDIQLQETIQLEENNNFEQKIELDVDWNKINLKESTSEWKHDLDYNLNHNNANTVQQIFRYQIQELEKFFQKLELEHVYLQKERDVLQKRIEKLETLKHESNDLFQSERNNNLNNLYLTLIELRILVEVVQQTKSQSNPISAMLNNTEDNPRNLTGLIKCNLENAYNLKTNIENFYTNYNSLEDNYEALKNTNIHLEKQVSIFCDSQKELDSIRVELEASASQLLNFLKQHNSSLDINKLEENLNMSTSKIESFLCSFDDIVNNHTQTCEISECYINPISKEVFAIESQYSNFLNNYNEKNFYLSSIEVNFNLMEDKLKKQMQKLEEIFCCSIDSSYFNYSDIELNTKEVSKNTTIIFQQLIYELKVNVLLYSDKTVIDLQEYQILNNHLNHALLQIPFLEDLILRHTSNINTLDYNIFQITTTINKLQMIQDSMLLKTNDNSLNLKLVQYSHKLDKDKKLLNNLHESINTLEEIKTDIEHKVTIFKNAVVKNANFQSEINELQTLGIVFEVDILKKTDQSTRYAKNVDILQENVNMLQQQLSLLKRNSKKQDKCKITGIRFQEDIKIIYAEINYYQSIIHELELDLQTLKKSLVEAEQDFEMLIDTEEELQDIISGFKKRALILDQTTEKNNEEIKLQLDYENKWAIYNNLIKQTDREVSQYKPIEHEVKELIEINKLEDKCKIKQILSLAVNHEFLASKVKIEEKRKEYLNTLQISVTKVNNTAEHLKKNFFVLQNQNYENRETCKILNTKHLILADIKHTLQQECNIEVGLNLSQLEGDLSRNKNQLQEIIRCYKKQQEDIEIKIGYYKSALFENLNESQRLIKNYNIMENYNVQKNSHVYDKLFELNMQLITNNKISEKFVKHLRTNTSNVHNEIETYLKSLDKNYETNVNHSQQLEKLKHNLCQVKQKYKILDEEHDKAINKLEITQNKVESLECQKLEFESQLMQQNLYFEEEYKKNVTHLNLQLKELDKKEIELKAKLAKNMNELQESNCSNNILYCEFNVMCTEFSNLKDDKAFVDRKLKNFDFFCRELKEDFDSFRNRHLTTLKENWQKMVQLQNDLLRHVEMLLSENVNLKASIIHLQNHVIDQQSKHDHIIKTVLDNLKKMENEKIALENKNKIINNNINSLIKEKEVLESNALGDEKYNKNHFVFAALLSAKDIFETGQHILEKDVDDNLKKIENLENNIVQDKILFQEKLDNKENVIIDIQTKIKLLQIELGENSSKNNKLLLELCTVNASLSSFSKQYSMLTQILSKQLEKSDQIETAKTNNDVVIQNIQSKNYALSKQIMSAKEVIEQLKEKLTNSFLKHQTLDLELQIINEKITHHQNHLEKGKDTIFDVTEQLLEKLDNIVKLQKNRLSFQNKINTLFFTLKKINIEQSFTLKNRTKIFKNAEIVITKIHKNTDEIQNYLLKHILHLNKNEDLRKQLINDVEKLIEAEKVANEILDIQMLELCSEKYFLLQVYFSLHHYINCILCIFKEIPIAFSLNNDTILLNISDHKVLNKTIRDVEQNLIYNLTRTVLPKRKEIEPANNVENLTNVYCLLNSIHIEQCSMFNLFLHLQKSHNNLIKKYDFLLESELPENTKIVTEEVFKICQNIVSVEKETTTLYGTYKKFDGYPIAYAVVLNKLSFERNYLENVLNSTKRNLEFLLIELSKNNDANVLKQLLFFKKRFFDIYSQFMIISRKLYEIVQTSVEVPFNLNNENFNQTGIIEKVSSEKIFKEIKQCCKLAIGLSKQLLSFKKKFNFNQIYLTEQLDVDINSTVNFNQDFKTCETLKRNFDGKVKKYSQKYALLQENLYQYYTLDCTKQKIDSDSELETAVDIKSLFGSNKRINTNKDTEEILQIKKAKLDGCFVDIEKIKRCTFSKNFMVKSRAVNVDIKQNNFIFLRKMQHKAVETSNENTNQKTNFSQQFPNNQALSLYKQNNKTTISKKEMRDFTIKEKKWNITQFQKSKNINKQIILSKTKDLKDYSFFICNVDDEVSGHCNKEILYPSKAYLDYRIQLRKSKIQSISHNLFLFCIILVIMISVNLHIL